MAKKNTFKKEKMAEKLLFDVNTLLRTDLKDPRLQFVSITKVELTSDLAYATLYWDTFDSKTRGDAKKTLEEAAGHIRSTLAKILKVRHVPTLTFIYDNQYAEEEKITKLLNSAKSEIKE